MQAINPRNLPSLEQYPNQRLSISTLLYQGQPHILVCVAWGLDKPATAAVVEGTIGEAIAINLSLMTIN